MQKMIKKVAKKCSPASFETVPIDQFLSQKANAAY